jgi:Ca-activated chloride channel family protein
MSLATRVALVVVWAAGATALGAQGQRIRSGVELVSLNVTAIDGQGKYATDLNEEEFEVFEDGAKQKLTFFSKTQQPISLALLLDTSASMDERMGVAQEAAVGFAKQMRKEDQAEVIDFDSQVRVLSPFTNDAVALEKAIRSTTPNGSTSLYNAIYIALKELKRVKAVSASDIRRQAIVLLSDGDDTSSLIEFDQVLDLAKRSEVVIYAIGLRAGEIARREFKEAEFVLKQLANETGGRAFFVTDARELAKIYQGIWDELSSQYAIAYSSANPKRDGAWRRVQVRLLRPNITARTKQGYYGPTGS